MMVRAPNGKTAIGEFAANHGYQGFRDKGLAIRRTILDEIVLRGARRAGARVEESTRVTDVARNGSARVSGVTAVTADGHTRTLRARYVVGVYGLCFCITRRLGLDELSYALHKQA